MKGATEPRAYRPLWNEYWVVGYILRYEKSVYSITEDEFVNICWFHSHGSMNPNRAKEIYKQLIDEAGL